MTAAFLLAAALSTTTAAASGGGDGTDQRHVWAKSATAVAGFPSGARFDNTAEIRTPLHRSDSVLFQDTVAGIGGRAAVTPAFSEVGAHATFAPVAIFDVHAFVGGITYWEGGFGPTPTDHRGGTLPADKAASGAEPVGTSGLLVSVNPTLKAKVGRVIVFDSWTVRHQRLDQGSNEPWMLEPFTDLVVGWTDTVVQHQPGVLVEVVEDTGGSWLRVGGTMRDRRSLLTEDRSLAAGGLVAAKTGASAAAPTVAGMALAYAVDDDRVGLAPWIGLQASWQWTRGLRKSGPTPTIGS